MIIAFMDTFKIDYCTVYYKITQLIYVYFIWGCYDKLYSSNIEVSFLIMTIFNLNTILTSCKLKLLNASL